MVFRIIAHDDGTFNTKVVLFLKVSLGTSLSLHGTECSSLQLDPPYCLVRLIFQVHLKRRESMKLGIKFQNHSPSHCLPSRKQTLALISIELSPPRHIQVQKVLSFWMPLSKKQSELINTNQHYSASIIINQIQSTSIAINQNQSAPISINQNESLSTSIN